MPGFDRSGPRGEGPLTGRGLGYCRGGVHQGFFGRGIGQGGFGRGVGQGGFPRGGGMGHCWGGGRNRWFQNRWIDTRTPSQDNLKEYATELENELKAVKQQLADLTKDKDSHEDTP